MVDTDSEPSHRARHGRVVAGVALGLAQHRIHASSSLSRSARAAVSRASNGAEASPAALSLAGAAARLGRPAPTGSRRLAAALGSAAWPQGTRSRAPRTRHRQASPLHRRHAPAAADAVRRCPRCRPSAARAPTCAARPVRSRRAGRVCARRRKRALPAAHGYDVNRPRRGAPLAGGRVRPVDPTSTTSRGAPLPRDVVVRVALSLSV